MKGGGLWYFGGGKNHVVKVVILQAMELPSPKLLRLFRPFKIGHH
jgi:hypothetical protein